MKVIRGPESWQFFAFVFVALLTIEVALLQGIPWYWLRAILDLLAFAFTFYVTMVNKFVRNWLVRVMTTMKELEKYTA